MNVQEKSIWNQLLPSYYKGGAMMCLQALPVNALNRASVVCCSEGLPFHKAISNIYRGVVDGQAASVAHFNRGLSGHFLKEVPRLVFKPVALVYKPLLDRYFGAADSRLSAWKANIVFSAGLAVFEMIINPFDTWRVVLQSGRGREISFPRSIADFQHLYTGAVGNGVRQFGTWLVFAASGSEIDRSISTGLGIDPYSHSGMVIKSPVQALLLTSIVYVFERVKNEMQYAKAQILKGSPSSVYMAAVRHIVDNRGGIVALTHGFAAKFLSNTILVYGANYLVREGKIAFKEKKAQEDSLGQTLIENELVRVSRIIFLPGSPPILHTNYHDRVIICLKGGDLSKVDAAGKEIAIRSFVEKEAYWSGKSPNLELHGNKNEGETPIEVIVVEVKKK